MTTRRASGLTRVTKIFTPVIAIIALAYIALTLIQRSFKASAPGEGHGANVRVGAVVPDFELSRYPTGKTRVSEILKTKKVLLLNFWASWCEACVAEMPSINQVRADFYEAGFEVLGINLDENPAAVIPRAIKNLGMKFPIFVDPDAEIADQFDVHAIPFTVVIDRGRKILDFHSGDRDWNSEAFRKKLEAWLKSEQ